MNQPFDKWSEMAKKIQEPFQEIAKLNLQAMQSFNFLKPEDLSAMHKPEELVEKNLQLVVENGHKALAYMQESFNIFEKTMLSVMQEIDKNKNGVKS